MLDVSHKIAEELGRRRLSVRGESILCREEALVEIARETLGACHENLVIDISAMPKRFFFPMLTLAIESNRFNNILVTYTTPERYGDSFQNSYGDLFCNDYKFALQECCHSQMH